jgi:salicylate hydroxylase
MQPHQGQGGSQSIEDAYTLARAIGEYLNQSSKNGSAVTLAKYLHLYQTIRLPRTAKVQETSRETGALYEQRAPPMTEEMPEEERYAYIRKTLMTRLTWIWNWDADKSFNEAIADLHE